MSSKSPRMKKASNATLEEYDGSKFTSFQASRRYTSLAKDKDFIKEKGFDHPRDFFQSVILNKGWKDLCKPPRPAVKAVVREFYTNLS